LQRVLGAGDAKSTLERTDARVRRVRCQIATAAFTIGSYLKHVMASPRRPHCRVPSLSPIDHFRPIQSKGVRDAGAPLSCTVRGAYVVLGVGRFDVLTLTSKRHLVLADRHPGWLRSTGHTLTHLYTIAARRERRHDGIRLNHSLGAGAVGGAESLGARDRAPIPRVRTNDIFGHTRTLLKQHPNATVIRIAPNRLPRAKGSRPHRRYA
jgi:hypothetical protein